ncbi:hypothetical protein PY365_20130 [Roseiarcaceae bacterium H3SJ34-1]|uniref:hypothetical protein n=1 Tax=Terripilifer ovatus TaxID=3032367 RepID=UPI003AB9700A|nr:hypothetical protein [Roseiarcaceae bacterium H3SJ34-1]
MTTKTRDRPYRTSEARQFPARVLSTARSRKGERLNLRLPVGLLAAIDNWIKAQDDPKPNRNEAICRLLQSGLLTVHIEEHQSWPITDNYVPCNALGRERLQEWHRSLRIILSERELQRVIQILSLRSSGRWSYLEVGGASWEPRIGHPTYVFLFETLPDLELLKL